MKIKRIRISHYRGIEELEQDVPPSGAIARGRNGGGKTSLLRAVKAALLGQDIGADAIRLGSDRAELLVDLDDLSVKRVITAKGQRLDVSKEGMSAKKPQTFLVDMLGTSSLDPLDLLTLKGKDRRARILAALPVEVTVEQLRTWWPQCPSDYDVRGHGLEVIAAVRAAIYAERTAANKVAKEAAQTARLAAERAESLAKSAPTAPADVQAATMTRDAAKSALGRLRSRAEQATEQAKATEKQRLRVTELRELAAKTRNEAGPMPQKELDDASALLQQAESTVSRLRAELAQAEATAREVRAQCEKLERECMNHIDALQKAENLVAQAAELEQTLAASAIEPVPTESLEQAEAVVAQAEAALTAAIADEQAAGASFEANEAAQGADQAHTDARYRAERLDTIVKALDAAPAEILAACDGIPGLSLEGDEVLLDGVRLDALCGAEQVRFCVEVARRANLKSKILVVDGLERLDPEQLEIFVREATRDDWQLIATRVDRGDVVIEGIEPEAAEVAA